MKKVIQYLTVLPIAIGMLTVNCLLPKISQAQYTSLHDFTGPTGDGSQPYGDLVSVGTFLYGTQQTLVGRTI